MFFIFGISSGEKKLDFVQTLLCSHCGKYGRLELYMTYMYFSLFFITIFKWNKRYLVKSTCCNTVFELDKERAKQILSGEQVTITDVDLHIPRKTGNVEQYCKNCGYPKQPEFEYCPKCGCKL